jgi:arabinose-5-phosphate isomerase
MHRGDSVPLVSLDAPLRDVLFVISARRLGVTGVVDGDGSLVGVITDGDVRRAMAQGVDVYSSTAADVMTASPKRIRSSDLAASALRRMEDLSITTLFVFDEGEDGTPAGIVHIHDLLRGGA